MPLSKAQNIFFEHGLVGACIHSVPGIPARKSSEPQSPLEAFNSEIRATLTAPILNFIDSTNSEHISKSSIEKLRASFTQSLQSELRKISDYPLKLRNRVPLKLKIFVVDFCKCVGLLESALPQQAQSSLPSFLSLFRIGHQSNSATPSSPAKTKLSDNYRGNHFSFITGSPTEIDLTDFREELRKLRYIPQARETRPVCGDIICYIKDIVATDLRNEKYSFAAFVIDKDAVLSLHNGTVSMHPTNQIDPKLYNAHKGEYRIFRKSGLH